MRRHTIGDEPLVPRPLVARGDDSLRHVRVSMERGLNFSEFDSQAAYLHLRVGSAEELELTVGAVAHDVARSVEPSARLVAERIRQELLRRQGRIAEIPTRHARPSNMQFSGHPDSHPLAARTEHIGLDIADGPADWHLASLRQGK